MVTVEATGTLTRRMRVELPAERVEKEIESRLKKVGRTARIKGFRPGKIPVKVVRQRYGGQIRQEVLAELMQKSYSDAVMQEKLTPAATPRIEPEQTDSGKDFAYVATFEVLPEINLKDLGKIEVEKPDVDITDADVDDMIENLRRQKSTFEAVDRAAAEGDRVIVDFDGLLAGEPIQGGQGREVPVILGLGQMLPDFEAALTGVQAGDDKSFKLKFPKDYQSEDLAGKKVEFTVHVHRVEEEKLPPLDDSLAELYGVDDGGLPQLKEDVLSNMRREADDKIRADIREQVMKGLLEHNPIEVPGSLVHQEMHSRQHEAMRRMGIEDHDQAPALENFRQGAERSIRLGLLLQQLIQDQNITLDSARTHRKVEEMCAGYERAEEMAASYLSNPQVMQQIEPLVLEEQAIEWLVEQGKVSTRKVGFGEYMKPRA